MTDFYQLLTGRPSPGRQSRRAFLRYANDGKNREEVERVGSRTQYRGEEPNPGARVQGERGRYEGRNGRAVVPYVVGPGGVTGEPEPSSLSEVRASDPYNGDFVAREDADRRARLPSYLRAGGDDAVEEEPVGRVPRNPENVIADATDRLRPEYAARREPPLFEAHYRSHRLSNGSHLRTSEPVFDPVTEAPADAFEPLPPEAAFDPTQEWKAAEERAGVRWREGRQTPADMLIAMIYGRRRLDEVTQENAEMRQRITGPRPQR